MGWSDAFTIIEPNYLDLILAGFGVDVDDVHTLAGGEQTKEDPVRILQACVAVRIAYGNGKIMDTLYVTATIAAAYQVIQDAGGVQAAFEQSCLYEWDGPRDERTNRGPWVRWDTSA